MTLRLELTLPATAQVDAGERAILYESPDQCGSVSGFWRCRVSRGQEGSGRGDTHSQISLEVTNCQLSLHAARVPGRRPVTVARALRPYAVPCTSAPRGPVCVLQCLPILVACPGREHREPRRDGREDKGEFRF